MNKDRFSRILKSKGFYLSLLTGVLAVAAICFVCLNTKSSDNKKNGLNDLNAKEITQQVNGEQKKDGDTANKPEEDKTVVSDKAKDSISNKAEVEKKDTKTNAEDSDKTLAEKPDSAVTTNGKAKKSVLSFDEDATLEWPVKGNVIIPYDIEHGVQFPTLGQYKCSDAIVISAAVGTKVKSAANATVVSVDKDEELGTTVTADIGSGYQIKYGQLKNIKVKAGDSIKKGAVIGQVAKPTKYYSVEGPNLYMKVTQNNESVNPMYLLD